MSEQTYRRHAKYREAQLSPEFSQFLERSRNDNSKVNSAESVTVAGRKRRADESVGYLERRADDNYEGVGRAFPQVGFSDLVRHNVTCNVNAFSMSNS